jgi:glycosyltransferase involved in cell wall biosynthesis
MPRYVAELLNAMAEVPSEVPPLEWVSSTDLDPQFQSNGYLVHRVLPTLRDRSEFRTAIGWAFNRGLHYLHREWCFLNWLRTRQHLDTIHFQEAPPLVAPIVVRSLRRQGRAIFFTVHNVRPHAYPGFLPRWLVDRSLRSAYAHSDGLFVHSDALANELRRSLGATVSAQERPRVIVVDHGIWTVPGVTDPTEELLRRRLREQRLLCFGAIRRNKGIHLLLEAAARGGLAGFSITVAGEPSEPEYVDDTLAPLADQARAAGVPVDLSPRFVPDEDVEALFARHSALILPYTDGFVAQSGAAFMALAHGTPVVATPSGGLGELLTTCRIGALAAQPTSGAIAEAVLALFSASEIEIAAIAGGLRTALTELSWNAMATTTVAEYGQVHELRSKTLSSMAEQQTTRETSWST